LVINSISTCFGHPPHSAHILLPDFPASQQLQQDRQL